jgi:hypothetical protein
LAQEITLKFFGDTPPEGAPFRKAVMFITGENSHHFKRALGKFCRYLKTELHWDQGKIEEWLADPEKIWAPFKLATHRQLFAQWWAKELQSSRKERVGILRRDKVPQIPKKRTCIPNG